MSILDALRVQKMNQRSVTDLAALPQNEIIRLAQMGHIPADVVPVIISEKARMAKEMANLRSAAQTQGGMPTVIEQALQQNAQAEAPQSADSGLSALPTGQMFQEQNFQSGGIVAFNGEDGSWVQEPGGLYVAAEESASKRRPESLADYIQQYKGMTAAARAETPEEQAYLAAIKKGSLSPDDAKQQQWMRLLQAGLGIMGGRSPYALTNIAEGSKGALEGYASDIKAQREQKMAELKGAADIARTKRQEELQDIAGGAKLYEAELDRSQRLQIAKDSQLGAKYADNYVAMKRQAGDTRPESVLRDEGFMQFFKNYGYAGPRVETTAATAAAAQGVTAQGQAQAARATAIKEWNDLKLSDPSKREYNRLFAQDKKNAEAGNPTNLAETYKEQQIAKNAQRIMGGTPPAAPVPRPAPAATPLPLPTSEAELKDGAVYQTARGLARWNAATKQFIPVK